MQILLPSSVQCSVYNYIIFSSVILSRPHHKKAAESHPADQSLYTHGRAFLRCFLLSWRPLHNYGTAAYVASRLSAVLSPSQYHGVLPEFSTFKRILPLKLLYPGQCRREETQYPVCIWVGNGIKAIKEIKPFSLTGIPFPKVIVPFLI